MICKKAYIGAYDSNFTSISFILHNAGNRNL